MVWGAQVNGGQMEHEGVEPDIVCFAKGVGSGMPIGGIIARKKDVMVWTPGAHGSTYGGNPVAAVSALATLNVIEEEGLHGSSHRNWNNSSWMPWPKWQSASPQHW